LVLQILTGFFLSLHYTSESTLAFSSVSHITRDVWFGWLLRSLHANSASFFFICLYFHIGRGVYYGSYCLLGVWSVGVLMLLVTMASAFLGYTLPWGQISFWGATVITNLFSALPYFGVDLVFWLWGGFSVDAPTLSRFYSFHFVLPFVLTGLTALHISLLHFSGSSNPLGVTSSSDKVQFHSYFTMKDIFGFILLLGSLLAVCLLYPNLFLEADNFVPANSLSTPTHIIPEWYFLFAYAILRCVPSKLGGVLALLSSILALFTLMFRHSQVIKGLCFYGLVKLFFWSFVVVFLMLTAAGSWPAEVPFLLTTRVLSCLYFSFYFFFGSLRALWEELIF